MRRPLLAAVAAISMIGASSAAQAQSLAPPSAAALSVGAHMRAGADTQEASDLRGGFIIPTLAVLAIIGLIYLLTKGDDATSP